METIFPYNNLMKGQAGALTEQTKAIRSILRLGAFLQREGSRLLHDHALGQQHFVVLKYIEEHGPVSQKHICSDLLYEKSNISKIIAKLNALKLISVSVSQTDSRVTILSVSVKGRKIVDDSMKRLREWNAQWLGILTDNELMTANRIFDKLLNNTDKEELCIL